MISQTYNFTLSGGTSPYTYQFTSTDSCLTITSASGSSTGTISAVFTYEDASCLSNTDVTLTTVDANGCSESQAVVLVDTCNLSTTSIQQSGFQFSTTASGGTPSYTYDWSFDSNIFTENTTGTSSNVLNLVYNPSISPVPETSDISVTVTDSNNCSVTSTYTVTFDVPELSIRSNLVLPCSQTNNCNTNHYSTIQFYADSQSTIDWDTLNITGTTCWNNLGDGRAEIGYNANNASSVATQFSATVQNELGITSNVLLLPTTVLACKPIAGSYITSVPTVIQLTADDNIGDEKTIDLASKTLSSSSVDWSTFTITTAPTFGTAAINANQELVYTIVNLASTTTDTITWSVQNIDGDSVTITEIINRNIIAAPVTVGDSICTSCNNPTAEIDILANDTGDIDRNSVSIVVSDPDVSFVKTADNNFIFTTAPSAGLTSVLQYTVKNTQGVTSNQSAIIISSICAGNATNRNITCATKTFDLIDYFSDVYGLSYSIAEVGTGYTGQGGTITNPSTTASVDFSAITPGTYTFELTMNGVGPCIAETDTEQIVITLGAVPNLTIDSAVNNGNDTATVTFTVENIPQSNITITNNAAVPTFVQSLNVSGTTGTFVMNLDAGANDILITGLSNCNTILTDTTTIAN